MASSFNFTITLLLFSIAMMSLEFTSSFPLGAYLKSGQTLKPGRSLSYGGYSLIMQRDCELALYDPLNRLVWSTWTNGRGSNCRLKLQHDGNLVIYANKGEVVWTSGTNQRTWNTYFLILQEDHNIVLYDNDLKLIWFADIEK